MASEQHPLWAEIQQGEGKALERQRLLQSYDEQIAWETELNSLDLAPLQQAFAQRGKPLDLARMKSLKLIREEQGKDHPTHGLMILLGLYEQVEIKCSRFKGTSMAVFLDKKEYQGDLFSQLAQTEAFIKNHLHLKAEILGLQRTESYEIPIPAIREALINAVVHRDYSNAGRDIKVGIYDDVLNIVSPGGLPHGLTLNEVLKGRSEIRNKVIARVFKELGYIEQWGSGMSRIHELCQEADNPAPAFSESGDFIDIEFHRTEVVESGVMGGSVGGAIGGEVVVQSELTERQQAVLQLIIENPRKSHREIAEALNINASAVQKHLDKLKEAGAIERIGGTRGYWKVKV
ncbi:Winged helix-turn-helix DNA-binding [Marinospirillum celere]|uniref:Winged helix-turn-helix DNA-binding n=1 Tax=Marinospirillum celere TaxID=1122252 RepID=A0A1I1ETS0_9GAMM|nr:ATP-binding protein [Marinospirillum celere]SFB88320.1 Winged helix-turn-helix DNA-binding [Marinospirillum celere]